MASVGWIILHRKIEECDIWLTDEPYDKRSAWVDLLLSANHEDNDMIFDGHKITIRRGQHITSVRKLSAKWGWGKSKVLSYLRLLEECEMITRNADSRRTLITIVNYDFYQSDNIKKRTLKGHSRDSDGTVTGHSSSTNKQINNERNNDNNDKQVYGEYHHVRLTDKERDTLMNEFGEVETSEAIKYLDEYIEMKGYKAKNHYLCMRKWVFDAIRKNKPKTEQNIFDAWMNA